MKNKYMVACLIAGLALILMAVFIQGRAGVPLVVQLPMVFKGSLLPPGGQVVFTSNRDGDPEIFRMDYDGSDLVKLTDNTFDDSLPDWSPDGAKIAFTSNMQDDTDEIYVMDPDGANITRLTTIGKCSSPHWSPDGQYIAFYCHNLDDVIYVMEADGGNLTQVSEPQTDIQDLTWSPDGQQIAFSTQFASPAGVYAVPAEGGEATLIFESEHTGTVAWSPDGRWLAVDIMVTPSYTFDIFLYDLDNETLGRVTTTTVNHFHVDWYPLGTYIIFQGFLADGMTSYIYSIAMDGNQLQQLSDGGSDYAPDWTP